MLRLNKRFGILSVVLVLVLACVFLLVWNFAAPPKAASWQTYEDPRYGFTVQVPGDWTVIPRPGDDDSNVRSAVLTFKAPEDAGEASAQIVIGLRSTPYDPSLPLAEWTQGYSELGSVFNDDEIKILKEEYITLAAADEEQAYYVHGQSPLTEYQFVNIPRQGEVWFIWTNMDVDGRDLFLQVVKSFTF